MSTKQKSWLLSVVGLLLVVGVIVAIKVAQIKTSTPRASPSPRRR